MKKEWVNPEILELEIQNSYGPDSDGNMDEFADGGIS